MGANNINNNPVATIPETPNPNNPEIVDSALLEKSWSQAIEDLNKSIAGKAPLSKGKKNNMEKEEGDEEDEDEGSPEDEEEDMMEARKKKVKKSLSDYIAEEPESEIAMDIEPFLKSLADGIDAVIRNKTDELDKSVAYLTGLVKSLSKAFIASTEMTKSVTDQMNKMSGVPIPSASRLHKSQGDRFDAQQDNPQLSKDEIMQKAFELQTSGKISVLQTIALEGRLNKGLSIPNEIAPLFVEVK